MKKIGWIMTLLLIMSSFSVKLIAQKNLDALVKKCETMPSVNMEVIRQRNDQTKQLQLKIISIRINENPELVNEFLAAFKKDEDQVIQVIESKKGDGQNFSLFYKFESVSYTISYGEKKEWASISAIY